MHTSCTASYIVIYIITFHSFYRVFIAVNTIIRESLSEYAGACNYRLLAIDFQNLSQVQDRIAKLSSLSRKVETRSDGDTGTIGIYQSPILINERCSFPNERPMKCHRWKRQSRMSLRCFMYSWQMNIHKDIKKNKKRHLI